MKRRGAVTALVVFFSFFVITRSAAADDNRDNKKEAQQLFTKGLKQAEAGDNQGAVTSFRAAYDASPSYKVLYNIGQLCERLNDIACAVRSYEQYLREGGSSVPSKRKTEVQADLQNLSKSVAMISVTVNFTGADIFVDNEPVAAGHSPLPAPIPLNPGEHKITARKNDKSIDRDVKVAGGEVVSIDLQIPKEDPPAPPTAPAPTPAPSPTPTPKSQSSSFPIVPWAVTGALAVGTIVTGVLASSAYSDFKETRDSFPVTRQDLDDSQGKARDLFLVSAIFAGATVISAGVASYFTFFAPHHGGGGVTTRVGLGSIMIEGTIP